MLGGISIIFFKSRFNKIFNILHYLLLGRISSNSQRRRVRPSRPEQSFSQQTEDLGGSSSDRDSVSARRSQGKHKQSINYKTSGH